MDGMAGSASSSTAATRYKQVAQRLRAAIAAGTYPVGGKLPSVRVLGRYLSCAAIDAAGSLAATGRTRWCRSTA